MNIKKIKILILALVLSTNFSFSQNFKVGEKYYNSNSFENIHLKNKKYRYEYDAKVLANLLTYKIDSKIEKLKAVYYWIANNIKYDCKLFNEMNSEDEFYNDYFYTDSYWILKRKKTVCEGYAWLLNEMCNSIGINTLIIHGYSFDRSENLTTHAWNMVELEDGFYLVDVTWSAGFSDCERNEFTFAYNKKYFLMKPSEFIKEHYPNNSKYQLLKNEIKKEEFINSIK